MNFYLNFILRCNTCFIFLVLLPTLTIDLYPTTYFTQRSFDMNVNGVPLWDRSNYFYFELMYVFVLVLYYF